jgi:hypothetical protein
MDLRPYIGRLPYASEMFGVYRPMVGWASKRKRDRIRDAERQALSPRLRDLLNSYAPRVELDIVQGEWWIRDNPRVDVGVPLQGRRLSLVGQDDGTFLMPGVENLLAENGYTEAAPENQGDWESLVNEDTLRELLRHGPDGTATTQWFQWQQELHNTMEPKQLPGESNDSYLKRVVESAKQATGIAKLVIERESCLAAALIDLVRAGAVEALIELFYAPAPSPEELQAKLLAMQRRLADPFTEFDPTNALNGVTVSPIGIVHLYRQYFFEFDSFLGPSVEHVWLPPGATVEIIESSTRKHLVERATTTETGTTTKSEREERVQEELSDAVRQENRDDTKLGFSTTVSQSWPGGNATATGNLNLDTTQQMSREDAYKRLREQTSKLSTEIRSSFKTTFRTVTETTDVSSKRLILQNPSTDTMQNYELRRKMRQVGVQVQDVGTYLCWETFVEEPGEQLGLANLVHVAKPPDVTPLPNPATIPVPERKTGVAFQLAVGWTGVDHRQKPEGRAHGIPLGRKEMPIDVPDGYEVDLAVGDVFQLQAASAMGEGGESFRTHTYLAEFVGGKTLDVGLAWNPNGLRWTHDVSLQLTGSVALKPTTTRLQDIRAANDQALAEHDEKAKAAEVAASAAAFYKAAQERIEQAAAVGTRPFRDLREEERTVVYRALIRDLMAKDSQTGVDNYTSVEPKRRHVYATVLNAIFDIDAMLYFVAPEWWKPRRHSDLVIGRNPQGGTSSIGSESIVGWNGGMGRDDNYYITSKSVPARLGSSLGWLLQLDGDDNRNRFLNAPWVRAVIPIRPGKEQAARAWLTRADVEGTDGLNAAYAYPSEYGEISAGLAAWGLQASDPPTVGDAITYLCVRVSEKHEQGTRTSLFPDRDGIDDEDKVWATPVERVYEHGFYPLERSFRADPREEPADSKSGNYQVMAQWTEILPTDQIVPVSVEYDPSDGRLKKER